MKLYVGMIPGTTEQCHPFQVHSIILKRGSSSNIDVQKLVVVPGTLSVARSRRTEKTSNKKAKLPKMPQNKMRIQCELQECGGIMQRLGWKAAVEQWGKTPF